MEVVAPTEMVVEAGEREEETTAVAEVTTAVAEVTTAGAEVTTVGAVSSGEAREAGEEGEEAVSTIGEGEVETELLATTIGPC